MAIRKRTLFVVLILLTTISTVSTFYYGYKLKQLQHKFLNVTKIETKVIEDEDHNDIEKLDSLIILGDYQKVLQFSKELDTTSSLKNNPKVLWRSKLITDLVQLKKANKQILAKKTPVANNEIVTNIETEDAVGLKEALQNSLNKIEQLKNQLNAQSSTEYLTFKTTKDIKLHYIGKVKNKKANGFGIALLESGSRYEGNWKDNLRHGHGNFYWDDGEHYEGTFVNDKREGIGTYYWSNGDRYVGHWKDDKRSGEGNFYNKKGKLKASGIWENDQLAKKDK
ncbi:MORN repeat-containing protein [Aquimarina agarivorans]|uniref:MORN repeat-containing protein n=1 Tax=Aquimarina agarivorans TaxID=980584 RepID=UPI000248E7B6|nr:phosphatidylinositol-4-phosphate 5-kinase [Aquimarina agarivorans]